MNEGCYKIGGKRRARSDPTSRRNVNKRESPYARGRRRDNMVHMQKGKLLILDSMLKRVKMLDDWMLESICLREEKILLCFGDRHGRKTSWDRKKKRQKAELLREREESPRNQEGVACR